MSLGISSYLKFWRKRLVKFVRVIESELMNSGTQKLLSCVRLSLKFDIQWFFQKLFSFVRYYVIIKLKY